MKNKVSFRIIMTTLMITILSTSVVFATEVDTATANANHYGFLTLIHHL